MPRAITCFAILLLGLGGLIFRVPHLRLAVQLASGEIDGRGIPVTDFVPAVFAEPCRPIRLENLAFAVPERARLERVPRDGSFGFLLQLDGLMCYMLPPRNEPGENGSDPGEADAVSASAALQRQAAMCASSGRDLSFWMSVEDVEQLQEQLELRPVFCLGAERIEVVRLPTLSGLLLTWKVEQATHMAFNYSSPDQRIKGSVLLRLPSESPELVRAARALVSSFRIEPGLVARSDGRPE